MLDFAYPVDSNPPRSRALQAACVRQTPNGIGLTHKNRRFAVTGLYAQIMVFCGGRIEVCGAIANRKPAQKTSAGAGSSSWRLQPSAPFFLIGLNGHHLSWIHGLSGWPIIVLPFPVAAARRHDVQSRAKHMRGMVLGGLLISGLFSFPRGRTLWSLFFTI